MKRLVLALLFTYAMASCSEPAAPPAPLEIADVWTRDTVGSIANAAVFMTITSPTPDRLLAASTPVAKQTDLMTMRVGGRGAMQMIYMDDINLPAGKPVSLNPRGRHVWLDELTEPLKAGESFPLTLRFEHAGEREVTVAVIAPAATPPMSAMGM